jgi:hypothetical protein
MKKSPEPRPLAKPSAVRLLFPVLLIGGVGIPATAGSDSRKEKPVVMESVVVQEGKTHTLFMGADISINLDKDLYPVRDVQGSSWVINVGGKDKVISAREAPLNLKITPTLKLAEGSATIVGFKREAAYSFDNDPSVRITRGLTKAAALNADLMAVSSNAQHIADAVSNKALGPASMFASSDQQFGDKALMYTAMTIPAITHPPPAIPGSRTPPTNPLVPSTWNVNGVPLDGLALSAKIYGQAADAAANQTENGDEPAGRLATSGLDAMDVEFTISSPKPLYNPYVVTMTRFHTKGTKPGIVQNLVYAQALDPIDSHLSNVHFVEEGFPFDYELIDFQLHIYDRGVEVATSISSKRVELTRDEAFEYVKMEYISVHRGDTLPPLPAMGKLPAELPLRLAAGKYSETFFVKVSKDGVADEPFLDFACSKKVEDPFLESVVRSIRFKPALAQGKPVDGIAALNLSKLQI